MLKKYLSDSTQRWLKIFLYIYALMYLFYLLSKFGFFLYVNVGMCIGIAFLMLISFIKDKRKEKAIDDFIAHKEAQIKIDSEREVN